MGLSWQQGPLSPGAIGRFLVPESLPKRLLYAERLRRRMRVRFGGTWIADSENVLLLFEPGRYPVKPKGLSQLKMSSKYVSSLSDVLISSGTFFVRPAVHSRLTKFNSVPWNIHGTRWEYSGYRAA